MSPKPERLPVPDMRKDLDGIHAKLREHSRSEGDCLLWTGFRNRLGYGETYWRNRKWMAHRLLYAATYGAFDPWLDIMHTCDNPSCIAIRHLKAGTVGENMRDSVDKLRAKNSKKTHCPQGHAYAEHGTSYSRGYKPWRSCKICQRARGRIRAGWPVDRAYSEPLVPHGYRAENANWKPIRRAGAP